MSEFGRFRTAAGDCYEANGRLFMDLAVVRGDESTRAGALGRDMAEYGELVYQLLADERRRDRMARKQVLVWLNEMKELGRLMMGKGRLMTKMANEVIRDIDEYADWEL